MGHAPPVAIILGNLNLQMKTALTALPTLEQSSKTLFQLRIACVLKAMVEMLE